MPFICLYERDYKDRADLHAECEKWKAAGRRVLVWGYSSINCWEA